MNENTASKRRDWIKNAAIIFLAIMLVLTFFSNTIMNYSLPEVATQYVQRGSITAKVRGTGNVEATDPYNVIVKESRVISGVAVKQGDVVEKDQVLYYLEDTESEELKAAQEKLAELELSYMKQMFGSDVSPEVIDKVASGRVDNFASYRAMVVDMENRLQAAQDRVKECQDALDALKLQSTISTNNNSVSTSADKLEQALATADLANAQEAFNSYKAAKVADLQSEITEKKNQISDLKTLISNAQSMTGSSSTSPNPSASPGGAVGSDVFEQRKKDVAAKKEALAAGNYPLVDGYTVTFVWSDATEEQIKEWYNHINWDAMKDTPEKQLACQAAYGEYRVAVDLLNNTASTLEQYGSSQDQLGKLATLENQLASLEAKLAEVNAISVESSDGVKDAKNRLDSSTRNITELNAAAEQSSVTYANKIVNAEAALANAQAVLALLKEERADLTSDINAELDLSKINKDIADKKAEIVKLQEKSMGATITAPVAGTVTSLAYVAGETTKPEEAAAVIQVEGKGFTLSFSVTNEQAKKVQVGDVAELQNAWYYDDVQAVLAAVKPDPESAGRKKILEFRITGTSVQAGQALNLSVGQRSAEYELVVPNSAIREDNNGKFILIVEQRSSPIGNRYIATRVDVQELASDDNNTAIAAGLYGYEYVITTSTKPVEAGQQVRLNES